MDNRIVNNKRTQSKSFIACIYIAMMLCCVLLLSSNAAAEKMNVGPRANSVTTLSATDNGCVLEVTIGNYERSTIVIDNQKYQTITLPHEPLVKEKGNPELPKISRSIAIPGETNVSFNIIESEYVEHTMNIASSRGILSRSSNPHKVKHTFGSAYKRNAFFPEKLVQLSEPYLIRNVRGISLDIFPFRYNPVAKTLRIYTRLIVEILYSGKNTLNSTRDTQLKSNKYFAPLLHNHFINYAVFTGKERLVAETGSMLVIAYSDFLDEMQPFIDHKNAIGLPTTMINFDDVGTTAFEIEDYIQDFYDSDSSLTFVLLVGDNAQIPTLTAFGGGSDPSFALVSGDDYYPDIIIGRFSAETEAHVETMVERSIHYETEGKGSWFHNGMGIASNQGPGDDGEDDYEHLRNIRSDLLGWYYTTIDEFYDGSQGGMDAAGNPTSALISSSINDGTSIINYTGHGSNTNWTTSGFSVTNVNDLENDDELPFIFSVACVVGNFTDRTCFAESWLRAENDLTGRPTGAIGFYGSTINQSWSPPMEAQDEFNTLLANEDYISYGALCYNAASSMMDAYGGGPAEAGTQMFLTWHIFGDPSINVAPPCFPDLPNPVLNLKSVEPYSVSGNEFIRYRLEVENWTDFPNILFEPASHLPPCGSNPNSARSWINIYDNTGTRLYGFCGFDSNDDLTKLWFSLPKGQPAPNSVYIVIDDRECDIEYESNRVKIAPNCYPKLPKPKLKFTGTEKYSVNGKKYVRYRLEVTNWKYFPDDLFKAAPYLPPCGSNTNASRSWVDIYSLTGKRLYGFCGFNSNDDLTKLWYSVPVGTIPPSSVYIVINDRACDRQLKSNSVIVNHFTLTPIQSPKIAEFNPVMKLK